MTANSIDELGLVCVLERGVPNLECVAFKVRSEIDLGLYGVTLALVGQDGLARPIRDSFYWFGTGVVKEGDWLLLYTGGGEPRKSVAPDGTTTYIVFWGRSKTLFANSSMVPVLFHMDAMTIGEVEGEKDQIGQSEGFPAITSSQLRIGS